MPQLQFQLSQLRAKQPLALMTTGTLSKSLLKSPIVTHLNMQASINSIQAKRRTSMEGGTSAVLEIQISVLDFIQLYLFLSGKESSRIYVLLCYTLLCYKVRNRANQRKKWLLSQFRLKKNLNQNFFFQCLFFHPCRH